VTLESQTPATTATANRSPVFAARWIGYVALAVVFAIACVLLSNWQFARRQEAVTAISRVEANFDAAPVALGDLVLTADSFNPDTEWRQVSLTGHYLPEEAMLIRNRVNDSEPGFDTAVPFQQPDGTIFIVDRGWLPTSADGSVPSNIPTPPSGTIDLVVHLRPSEHTAAAATGTETTLPTLNVADYAKRLSGSVYIGAYGALVTESPSETHGVLLTKPSLDEGNHLSYALQWIAFALLGFIAVAWIIRRELKLARNPRATIPRRKIDRSAAAEDAEIDAQL